jgi:hypothetical protein
MRIMTLTRITALLTLLLSGLPAMAPAATAGTTTSACQFMSPNGTPSAIKHVIHIQFDNVHFRRDDPNVPSDLEQMPHLLNFIEQNGVLLSNEWTPLIAHTGDDLVTGLTGLYGDKQGLPFSNSFEIYNDANPVGSYNTSVFTYWTDTVKQDGITNPHPDNSFQMIDAPDHNLQSPWVPFVNNGCNVGAVSSVNQVLENNTNDIAQVFNGNSQLDVDARSEANTAQGTSDFVGLAVHCADATCSTVGNGVGTSAKPEPNGQGLGALFGHNSIVTQVPAITQTDGTPITGFEGFDPTPQYTLGYILSLLKASVPVVYGYVADAHDSRNSCAATTPESPVVSNTRNNKSCGAFAPGEPGYVQQLKQWDAGFDQFFTQLAATGIDQTNTVFVFHSDENDHYAGTPPTNPGCDGVTTACTYDRTKMGEVTTDLPLLLQQQFLYDWGGSPARGGFNNTDSPYGIDFDTAPGFWIKNHPARTSDTQRRLEKGLAAVNAPNPYTATTAQLFSFLADQVGMQAEHMVSVDDQRAPGIVGFGQEDHFIQTSSLISQSVSRNPDGTIKSIAYSSGCNTFPLMGDVTCTSNGFIWLHGDYAPDIDNTWAAFVGPGVKPAGVDASTFADHADIRPTLMTLVCLKDSYAYEGRAILEDLQDSALPTSIADDRQDWTALAKAYKQVNAPLGSFGNAVIGLSTTAIRSDDHNYERIENNIARLASDRDALAQSIQDQLGTIPGCAGSPLIQRGDDTLDRLTRQAQALVDRINDQNEFEKRGGDIDADS